MVDWDEYFMSIAKVIAKKSKDPTTQVGCVIVDNNNRPVSFGYNGSVMGCDESQIIFEKPYKDMLSIHAEMNALIFAKRDLTGCRIYVTNAPCDNCLKHLLQAGVREFIYDVFDTNGHFMTEERVKGIGILLRSNTGVIYRNMNGETFFDETKGLGL
ncbi:MAG: dCMP deaminase family protein [Rickettsiales bacterium]|jgi:dCMP deaminase|nr:dCMP deaminase family protein [Rickettsiales bacterium]